MLLEKLKSAVYLCWLFAARISIEKRRWKNVRNLGFETPQVYYGHDHIPSRNERTGGAIVKFQDLQDEFPNTIRDANILYLLSSALPTFPEIMVREAKKRGVIFVLNQNGVAYPAWHGPGWEKKNRPMRFLLQQADYVVYQSEFCKTGADRFLSTCSVPHTVLYNPVDTKLFVPNTTTPSGLKILLAGSHQHLYRVRTALEVLKQILHERPEATLTIAGRYTWRKLESECMAEAINLAKQLDILANVDFCGGYTQAEAPDLFKKHHILLHTKYNDHCPRLVVEAMACGLPVVYSKSGGVPELVGDGCGVGIPSILDWEEDHPPNSSELAKAIIHVRTSLKSYAKLARERAEICLDVKPWKERHAAIFQELIDNSFL